MEAIQTALTSWGTTFSSDVTSMITTMLPIALGVVGLTIAIRYGIKFFRSTVGR